jgi:hypothetical protein
MKSIDQTWLGASGTASSVGLVAFEPLPWLDAQVRFQLSIDPINPFVVPAMTLDIAQIQEAETESPGLSGLGQPDQKVGDLLVLVGEPRAVAIARLAEPKRPARQRDTDPSSRHCCLGHLPALGWPGYFLREPRGAIRFAC